MYEHKIPFWERQWFGAIIIGLVWAMPVYYIWCKL